MSEYRIFRIAVDRDTDFRRFEQNLSDEIRRGWQPLGGISITQHTRPDGSPYLLLAQAAWKA